MLRIALFAFLSFVPALHAETLTVFAAASLKTALDQIARDWQADTGNTVNISYGGSAMLAQQIVRGAPADLFVSAAEDWMDTLAEKDLLEPGSREDLLANSLVLIAHGAAPKADIGPGFDLTALLGGGKLAMGLTASVPAGQYGKEALTALDLWDAVAPQVAEAENVRAALALVSSGEAPYGIVYASDAIADAGAGGTVSVVGTFPEATHRPIRYPAAVLASSGKPEADAFMEALQSDHAREIFTSQGFEVLK